MTACDDYNAAIQLYLDDELTGSDQQELLAHLENCISCKRELEELRGLSSRIRQSRPQVSAPNSLRARILEQAAHREQELGKVHRAEQTAASQISKPAGKRSSPRRPWLPMAIAAMLCLVAGLPFSISHLRREADASRFIDTAIVAHRGLTNASMPLDVQSDSAEVVRRWFASKVPFPFRMPNAGIASDDTAKYKLTGGRLLTFGGEQAALLAFQMPNDTVTVLIASGKKAEARGGNVTYSSGIRFHSTDRDDLHVVTWENKGLVYALIFSNKMANKRACAACHEATKAPEAATLGKPHWLTQ
jgi:anti-sigma factor RsiW